MIIPEIPGPFPAFIQNPANFFLLLYESAFSSHALCYYSSFRLQNSKYIKSGNAITFRNMHSLIKILFFYYKHRYRRIILSVIV